ncbi:MAG: hypothetical protein ABI625_00780 [bacterium]
MQFGTRTRLAGLFGVLMCVACSATEPSGTTAWSSDQANVVIVGNATTVQVLASGGCYGSYGSIDQVIPSGAFTLPGTYTQLTGAYPGHVEYAAEYSGDVTGNAMTLTITIPSQQRTIGPFHLNAGVANTWSACLYP